MLIAKGNHIINLDNVNEFHVGSKRNPNSVLFFFNLLDEESDQAFAKFTFTNREEAIQAFIKIKCNYVNDYKICELDD